MNKFDLSSLITEINPDLAEKNFLLKNKQVMKVLNKFLKFNSVNRFVKKADDSEGIDFIEKLFEELDFSFYVSHNDKLKIPSEGKLLIVANHRLGGLDALSLISLVHEVRQDVKVLVNNVLSNIEQLNDLMISTDIFSKKFTKSTYLKISECLNNEEVLIVFPAGEVSRLRSGKINDKKWSKGIVKLIKKFQTPVLPVYIDAKNSSLFYLSSAINKNISTALLPREIFNKKGKNITIKVGHPIPADAFNKYMRDKVYIKLLKKHVYNIHKDKKEIYRTERNIIHPVPERSLKIELNMSETLLEIDNDTKLFLYTKNNSDSVLKELSRLRELNYRKVGEGTGKKFDKDKYDKNCEHLILWNNSELEIVGSYRLGNLNKIIKEFGVSGVYNSQQFEFSNRFLPVLNRSLELGRSVIQHKYWRTNALDHLWKGIGMYLLKNPEVRYLFGSVSLSDNYSEFAKDLIIYYYRKWYMDLTNDIDLVRAKVPYTISKNNYNAIYSILDSNNYQTDFINLKKTLSKLGYRVPVLLRKYTGLCDYGGVKFLDFGIDRSFSNSIDCLVLVDLQYVKESFRYRYLNKEKLTT